MEQRRYLTLRENIFFMSPIRSKNKLKLNTQFLLQKQTGNSKPTFGTKYSRMDQVKFVKDSLYYHIVTGLSFFNFNQPNFLSY